MTGPKCLRCLSICQPEAGLFLQVAGIWGGSGAWLYRTEPSGFTPCDPVVKYGDISISVGDATCQQKADWKMKRTEMERLSDSLKFIRLTEGGRMPMRGVHLWGFRSGVNLLSPFSSFSLCPVVCLCVCLAAYLFLPGSAGLLARLSMCVSLSGCQFATLTSRHLCLTLQPCPRLLSPPMMSTSTLKPPPTTRSTVVSREPRSSWRSDTVTAWRGWVYQQESGRWFLRGNM